MLNRFISSAACLTAIVAFGGEAIAAPTATYNVSVPAGTATNFTTPDTLLNIGVHQNVVLNVNGPQAYFMPVGSNFRPTVANYTFAGFDLGGFNASFGSSVEGDTVTLTFTGDTTTTPVIRAFESFHIAITDLDVDTPQTLKISSPTATFSLGTATDPGATGAKTFLGTPIPTLLAGTSFSGTAAYNYFELNQISGGVQFRTTPTGAFTTVSAPEPTTLGLASVAIIGGLARRRRRANVG